MRLVIFVHYLFHRQLDIPSHHDGENGTVHRDSEQSSRRMEATLLGSAIFWFFFFYSRIVFRRNGHLLSLL